MSLLYDLRYSARALRKHPGFVLAIIFILALGIGANTAIFSVVNAVLIRPLPYEAPERLCMVWETNPSNNINRSIVSPANFLDWKEQSHAFDSLAAFRFWYFTITGQGDPQRYQGARVSASFFPLLGIQPALGRNFQPEEEQLGRDHVVLLDHSLWQTRFAGDQNVVGQSMIIDGESYTIVGVLPASFRFPRVLSGELLLWMPMAFTQEQLTRGDHSIVTYARLKQGVTLSQAQDEMDQISARLAQAYPKTNAGWGAQVNNWQEQSIAPIKPTLLLLFVVVGFVLLIACANIANLLLARTTARRKDIAIHLALGSSRFRLVQLLLVESLSLSLAGGAAGLLLAYWGINVLNTLLPQNKVPHLENFNLDLRVLGFTLAVSVLVGVIVGLIPALRAHRFNLTETLNDSRGTTETRGGRRLRNVLVIAEVALTAPLLISAALMLKSLWLLQEADRGFNVEHVLTMQTSLPRATYGTPRQTAAFYQQVLQRIQSEPGVQSASAVNFIPLATLGDAVALTREGAPATVDEKLAVSYRVIDQDYFRTLNIPLLRGRYFTEQDNDETHGVVIVNQTMARRYWPNEDPLGKRIQPQFPAAKVPWRPDSTNGWLTIVGVAADVRSDTSSNQIAPEIYLPYRQNPSTLMNLVVRSTGDPLQLAQSIRAEVLAVDANQPVYNIKTMADVLGEAVAEPRMVSSLLATFATIALALAAIGVYGVISYSVVQRTHEIGVRMALGAQRQHVLGLVVGQGFKLVLIGLAFGLIGAFAATRILSHQLYGVTPTDPAVFAFVSLLLLFVAILASYLPARRALRVDPIIALRQQ